MKINCIQKKYIIYTLFFLITFLLNFCVFAISTPSIDCRTANTTIAGDIFHRTEKGRFVIGVLPDKQILFGYPNALWSSYTTIYIQSPGNTLTIYGSAGGTWISNPADTFDAANNSVNTGVWELSGIRIKQNLTIVKNLNTLNNFDTIQFQYIVENTNTFNAQVGIRVMFDTQIGGNDNSPIVVAGFGRVIKEHEWVGPFVPDAWYTLDNYLNPTIKAQGTLTGGAAVKPDKLVIGQWDYMKEDEARWTYIIHPTDITDTAAAIFWDPVGILPFKSNTLTSYFGIPDQTGAELVLLKSVDSTFVHYGDTLSYTLSASNLANIPLTGLTIWDSLPWNTTFVDASAGYTLTGSSISWPPFDINDNLTSYSRWFRVKVNAAQGITVDNKAFGGYTDTYWNDVEYQISNTTVSNIATLTPSATPTITPTATITPTYTPTPPVLYLQLLSNFPNPAKSFTGIVFNLTSPADVKIRIYTISGEFIKQISARCEKGNNSMPWDLKNRQGNKAASGTYLYAIEAQSDKGEKQKKEGQMVIVR